MWLPSKIYIKTHHFSTGFLRVTTGFLRVSDGLGKPGFSPKARVLRLTMGFLRLTMGFLRFVNLETPKSVKSHQSDHLCHQNYVGGPMVLPFWIDTRGHCVDMGIQWDIPQTVSWLWASIKPFPRHDLFGIPIIERQPETLNRSHGKLKAVSVHHGGFGMRSRHSAGITKFFPLRT